MLDQIACHAALPLQSCAVDLQRQGQGRFGREIRSDEIGGVVCRTGIPCCFDLGPSFFPSNFCSDACMEDGRGASRRLPLLAFGLASS